MNHIRRPSDLWPACAAATIAALLAVLSVAYSQHFPNLGSVNDTWFGTDVQRHVNWALEPQSRQRWHLHPAPFALFKAWGFLLRSVGTPLHANTPLVVFALPTIAFTVLGLVGSALLLTSSFGALLAVRSAVLAMLVLVGPIVAFGPMPEAHVPGGVALLLQAVAVWKVFSATANDEPGSRVSVWAWTAFSFGALATAITLSNVIPATILGLALVPWRRIRARFVPVIVIASLTAVALAALLSLFERARVLKRFFRAIDYELNWINLPQPTFLSWSFSHLLLPQFGLPSTELDTWDNPFNDMLVTSVRNLDATPLQVVAFVLWCAGIACWTLRAGASSPERRFMGTCLLAALSLVGFHTVYAAYEAYMFSAHAWPYLVVPGVLAWQDGVRSRRLAPIMCITAAVALSTIQTGVGLMGLRALHGKTGQQPSEVPMVTDNARY